VRRYFNVSTTALALLTALFSVLSIIISQGSAVLHRHSETEFKVTGAQGSKIYLKVWNNGGEASTLLSYRLKFAEFPIRDVDLFPEHAQERRYIIPSGRPIEVALEAYGRLKGTCRPAYPQPCEPTNVLQGLGGRYVTLEVEIEESGHLWNLISTHPYRRTQSDAFSGNTIGEFIVGGCCV